MPASSVDYLCGDCGRRFPTAALLRRHRRDTHEPKKWVCAQCGKAFARKANYNKHIENPNVHRACSECGESNFQSKKQLLDHIRTQHGSQARLDYENEQFRKLFYSSKKMKNVFPEKELELLPKEDLSFPSNSVLMQYPSEYHKVIEDNWSWMKTKYTKRSVSAAFSFRFENGEINIEEVGEFLRRIHQIQNHTYKAQLAFGYIYRVATSYDGEETESAASDPMFFIPQKPSTSNPGFLTEGPWTVLNVNHLEDLITRLDRSDILEHLNLRRPSTKYIVELVTNIMVYVYKMEPQLIGCSDDKLPRYIMEKKSVKTLLHRNGRKEPWGDERCLFRCLAADQLIKESRFNMKQVQSRTELLFLQFCRRNGLTPSSFNGALTLSDLNTVEETFKVRIFVYELVPKFESGGMWREAAVSSRLMAVLLRKPSTNDSACSVLYLDVCDNHFSLICNINAYADVYVCGADDNCKRLFQSRKLCRQHESFCLKKENRRKVRCTGGGYKPSTTLYEELENIGISVQSEFRFMDCFATFDAECTTEKIDESKQARGKSTKHEAELKLASFSVCSSVEGFEKPRFFLSNGDAQELTDRCIDYLLCIQEKASEILEKRFRPNLLQLKELIIRETDQGKAKELKKLNERFLDRISQLHVFGWHSRGFDVPLIRSNLYNSFSGEDRPQPVRQIIKHHGSYLLLCTDKLKFLDMQSLISPHASYSDWLKSLEIPGAEKSFFPFRWFDSLKKLEQTHLPDRSLWSNDLKRQSLSDAEWDEVVTAWKEQNMRTMADFLEYYNNKDVSHFVDGVRKQQEFWNEQGICMITEGLSLSGLSLRLFNKYIQPDTYLALPRKEDYSYIRLLRKSICGGLAQVFRRLHVAGITKIRNGRETCKAIQGWDFNRFLIFCALQHRGMNE